MTTKKAEKETTGRYRAAVMECNGAADILLVRNTRQGCTVAGRFTGSRDESYGTLARAVSGRFAEVAIVLPDDKVFFASQETGQKGSFSGVVKYLKLTAAGMSGCESGRVVLNAFRSDVKGVKRVCSFAVSPGLLDAREEAVYGAGLAVSSSAPGAVYIHNMLGLKNEMSETAFFAVSESVWHFAASDSAGAPVLVFSGRLESGAKGIMHAFAEIERKLRLAAASVTGFELKRMIIFARGEAAETAAQSAGSRFDCDVSIYDDTDRPEDVPLCLWAAVRS